MHVFVTGAAGFIGTNLVRELQKQSCTVSCLVRTRAKGAHLQLPNVEVVVGDLHQPDSYKDQVQQADRIIHVAGVTKGVTTEDYFQGNLATTEKLAETVKSYAPTDQKIIYISSQAAAGPSDTLPGVNESSHQSLPVSAYGKSKRAAEDVLLTISDRFPVVILRPSIVFGPFDKGMHPLFVSASRGFRIKTGFRDFPVNLIYVADLVEATILAAESDDANGKTFYVTDGKAYPWDALLHAIAKATQSKTLPLTIPLSLTWLLCQIMGTAGRLLQQPQDLNPDKWHEIKQNGWLCDSKRLHTVLGFTPKWGIDGAMEQTVSWYRQNGLL